MEYKLRDDEQKKRSEFVNHIRNLVKQELPVLSEDDISLLLQYRDYSLQVLFSKVHPLMIFSLIKTYPGSLIEIRYRKLNELNRNSILGTHTVNEELECYTYRATQWIDAKLDLWRFLEILDRCVEEADRGYYELMK